MRPKGSNMYSKSIGKSKTGITSHITAIIATIVLLCGLFYKLLCLIICKLTTTR